VKYFKAACNLNCWLIALVASAVSLDIPVLKAGPLATFANRKILLNHGSEDQAGRIDNL
jgi:hypothetical protein